MKTDLMRIAMLSRILPEHARGGMQDHVWQLASNLARAGIDIQLISAAHPEGFEIKEKESLIIHYIPDTKTNPHNPSWIIKSRQKLIELHHYQKFDLIHSQSAAAEPLLAFSRARFFDCPLVLSLHGTHIDELKTRWAILKERKNLLQPRRYLKSALALNLIMCLYLLEGFWLRRRFDAIIATSNEQKALIKKFYPISENKIHLVYNAVDEQTFFPSQQNKKQLLKTLQIKPKSKILLSVSRLNQEKGIQYLIEAFAKILKLRSDLVLIIVGDGNYRSELEVLTVKLNLQKKIKFTGFIAYQDLPNFYNLCDIFVNPTIRANGYDLTILQAMACNKPVISSNIGSVPSVIEDKSGSTAGICGILVPPANSELLASAIQKLLDNKEMAAKISQAGFEKVQKQFSTKAMVEGTIKVYKEVIEKYKSDKV